MSAWRQGAWRTGAWRIGSWRGMLAELITPFAIYGRRIAARLPDYLISRSGNMFRRMK